MSLLYSAPPLASPPLAPPTPPLASPPLAPPTPSNSSNTAQAPTTFQLNASSDQSPPTVPETPPPSPQPPPPPVVSSPPPESTPAVLPPQSPPVAIIAPPPSIPSPPPPVVASSPPPQPSPTIPSVTPPPAPRDIPPSLSPPAPPADVLPPPPPPEKVKPTKPSHSSPKASPPPSDSPPADASPPPSTLPSPPKPVPSTSSPHLKSPPQLPGNLSDNGSPMMPPLPLVPTEKPIAKSTRSIKGMRNTTSSGSSSGSLNTGGAIAVGIVVGFALLSLVVVAVWFVQKRKKKDSGTTIGYNRPSAISSPQYSDVAFLKAHSQAPHHRSASGSDSIYSRSESDVVSNQRSWFSYDELAMATGRFSSQKLLGEGGFGCVYKGVLADGREVAVKQLKIGGSQGEREFRAEVEIITRVHHRHLVSLVGYCISDHNRLLVYEYVPNDTLYYHLHGKGDSVMSWATRVKVAAGAARGIAYLHEDCHPRIIHRDIKSSNILLDNSFEARVSDFGLAKIALELESNTHVSTRVMGTFGYMAPEYATSGKLTEKSDVYSFGVVLLELITGRKSVDSSQPLGDESLVEWARPLLAEAVEHEDLEDLVDSNLGKNYVPGEMFRMIQAAAACVRHSATKRPKMSQVVRALETLEEITDINNGMKPGQSQVYDSRQQSAEIKMFQRLAFGGSQEYSSGFFNQSRDYESRGYGDRSAYIP